MENLKSFVSRDFNLDSPARSELREIEKALIRDGYDRVMSVEDFISTPPIYD